MDKKRSHVEAQHQEWEALEDIRRIQNEADLVEARCKKASFSGDGVGERIIGFKAQETC